MNATKEETDAAKKAAGSLKPLLAAKNGREGGAKSKLEYRDCGKLGHVRSQCKAICATCGGKRRGAKIYRYRTSEKGEFVRLSVKKVDGFNTQKSCHDISGMDPTDGTFPGAF